VKFAILKTPYFLKDYLMRTIEPKFYTKNNLSWDEINQINNKGFKDFWSTILYSVAILGGIFSIITLFFIGFSNILN